MKQTVISILNYVVLLLIEDSVIAKISITKDIELDFQEVIKENSKYPPMPDKCPLRIMGGETVGISEVPYQTVIQMYIIRHAIWALVCGGSIVTHKHVITAAHCFPNHRWSITTYRLLAGTDRIDGFTKRNQQLKQFAVRRNILYCFRHKNYDVEHMKHDFAVLLLDSPVNFTENIQPIPMILPSHAIQLKVNGLCLVSGFGRIMENSDVWPDLHDNRDLRMVCVPIISTTECLKYYGRYLPAQQFCAGKRGKDSCTGDSGGPITYQGYLVGVVSYGVTECGWSPSLYTKLSSYTTGENVPFIANSHNIIVIDTYLLFTLICLSWFLLIFLVRNVG